MSTRHVVKSWPQFFAAIASGAQPFDIRYNDRGYSPDDRLLLREWDPDHNIWTGKQISRTITTVVSNDLILHHREAEAARGALISSPFQYALSDGWVVLGLHEEKP